MREALSIVACAPKEQMLKSPAKIKHHPNSRVQNHMGEKRDLRQLVVWL